MSNAKVRARRRRRGNRAWTAAMSPVELALVPLPAGATPALRVSVEHTCRVLKNWLAGQGAAAAYRAWLAGQDPVNFANRSWGRR